MENYTNPSTAAFGVPSALLCATPRPRIGTGLIAPISSTGHGTRLSFVGNANVDNAKVSSAVLGRVVDGTPMDALQGSPPRGIPR